MVSPRVLHRPATLVIQPTTSHVTTGRQVALHTSQNLAENSAATFCAALTRRSLPPLSYAADACILLLWRIATAADLTVSSSCSPLRRKVMKLLRVSLGQSATSPWRAKMAFTRLLHAEGAMGSNGLSRA